MKFKISLSAEDPKIFPKKIFKGVGMIRGEYLVKKYGMYVTKPKMQSIIRNYIIAAAEYFEPYDVWYRTIELPTHSINELEGVDHKIEEKTPMEGLRGVRRCLKYPKTFIKELRIASDLSQRYQNVHILFPFLYDVSELEKIKCALKKIGYKNKIGIMTEIPSTILCLDKFCKNGVDNITIGLNDLTEFTLGSDRFLDIYNRNHPAVRKLISMARDMGKDYSIETVLGGDIDKKTFMYAKSLRFDAITLFSKDIKIIKNLDVPNVKLL